MFTWDDRLVDNVRYFKHNFTADLQDANPTALTREQFMLRKPVVLMQTRKTHTHPNSLYHKRDNIIQFFENKASGLFDLWGRNWEGHRTWRGAAKNKMDVLKNYRFCIAFENCNHARGYITEKLLDCFLAGVVPVYWGAPNVTDHVPAECFIDMRRFKFYEDLLDFMNDLTYDDYMKYMYAAQKYLASPQSEQFFNAHFVDMLVRHMEELK
jgi:alpha(1,3/1,4) fucosyltransferase